MHLVVYTWWCWHICKGGRVPRVERGVIFGAFEKIKCIFFIAPVGSLEKSWEVFLSKKHSTDALCGGTGRWPLASGVLSDVAECTGRTGVSPVLSVRCAGGLATLSAHESGEHRTLRARPVACVR